MHFRIPAASRAIVCRACRSTHAAANVQHEHDFLLSLLALTAACLFLLLDRNWSFHFFDISHGGSPLLWQHLFWFFAHPWVYIISLPATGIISMLLPVFARPPIVGYTDVAVATVFTGVAGMGVWVYHMFASGLTPLWMSFFSAASMVIAILSTVERRSRSHACGEPCAHRRRHAGERYGQHGGLGYPCAVAEAGLAHGEPHPVHG
jgi:hypothetical protein